MTSCDNTGHARVAYRVERSRGKARNCRDEVRQRRGRMGNGQNVTSCWHDSRAPPERNRSNANFSHNKETKHNVDDNEQRHNR